MEINMILPEANMFGGIKAARLISEAMVRRGHRVNIIYCNIPKRSPRISQPFQIMRKCWRELKMFGKQKHHLEKSTANLISVPVKPITNDYVPDADVTIGTWWEVIEWIRNFSNSKGIKVDFVQGHDATNSPEKERVVATYKLPMLKIAVSPWLKRVLKEKYDVNDVIVVPNGIERVQFDSHAREKNITPTVGFVFSPHPIKDMDTALEALILVQKSIPSLRVMAFGAYSINFDSHVINNFQYYHRPPQHKIPEIYRKTDCWFLSSLSEGLPMPMLEAAACHCPIVATDYGGAIDIIENGVNGYIVPPKKPEMLAKALISILNLPNGQWKKMSESSYEVSKKFDWDRSAEILEEALLYAIENKL
jgi:glycosyltransferase involved in cell wall biosynthesis